MMIISYDSQQEVVYIGKSYKEEYLSSIFFIGDDFIFCEKFSYYFGSNSRGVNIVYQGEIIEEKIYGIVEMGV